MCLSNSTTLSGVFVKKFGASRGVCQKKCTPFKNVCQKFAVLIHLFVKKSETPLGVCLSKNSAVLFHNVFVRECNAS
jgi:hypothetical protein